MVISITYVLDFRIPLLYPEVIKVRSILQFILYGYLIISFFTYKIKFSKLEIIIVGLLTIFLMKDMFLTSVGLYTLQQSSLKLEFQFIINTIGTMVLLKQGLQKQIYTIYFYSGIILLIISVLSYQFLNYEIVNYNTIFFMIFVYLIVAIKNKLFLVGMLIPFTFISNYFGARNIIALVLVYILFQLILRSRKSLNALLLIFLQSLTMYAVIFNNQYVDKLDEILTRRVYIWKYYFSLMTENPINIIVGRGITQREDMLYLGDLWGTLRAYHQHNTYVTYFYENGILGLILIGIIVYVVIKGKNEFYTIFFLISVYLIEETIHIGDLNVMSALFLISFLNAININNPLKNNRRNEITNAKGKNPFFRTKKIL